MKGLHNMDDTFTLYDLKVEVVASDRPMVCSHKVGDYFLPLLDGTANSLPAIIPFMSVFVFIGSALTGLSPVVVAGGTIYGFVLFFVFLGAVLTGWGCQKEE
jgi:hypothetical protein